jgi:hypothetical protein
MPNRVTTDGRIIVEVRVIVPPAPPSFIGLDEIKELVADTGSPITMIPWSNVGSILAGGGTLHIGPIVKSNFGATCILGNITMEVEVEDYGGGNPAIQQCSRVHAHFLKDHEGVFLGVQGLLGMDQFDSIGADPVKAADGKKVYLARRR